MLAARTRHPSSAIYGSHHNFMMAHEFHSVGLIGLGAMGMPMLSNLVRKLPDSARLFVQDVSLSLVNEATRDHPGRVVACRDAKEVASRSVRME